MLTGDKAITIRCRGDNEHTPIAIIPYTLKMRAGCEGGGKGALIQEDKSATLATNNDQVLFQPVPGVLLDDQGGQQISVRTDGKVPTLRAETPGNLPCVLTYAMQGFGDYKESDAASGLKARDYKDSTDLVAEVVPIAIDRAFFNQGQNAQYAPQTYEDGTCPTLVAKGPSAVCVRYIVRRLTPTECARLQGFADLWGDLEAVDTFTQKDYQFWLEVRNTHAAINGKKVQDYTVKQMLTWYNKLQTDSSEYKMWGNGIALPPALYCMQGIADALNTEEEGEAWML